MSSPQVSDELRYQLLKAIKQNPEISQRELADQVGISLGKTNYCLKALVEAGHVKVENFARSNRKLNYAYLLTPKGVVEKAAVTLRFLRSKQEQFEQLKREIETLKSETRKMEIESESSEIFD